MNCPKCQTVNSRDSQYCKKCATALPSDEAQASFTRTLETTADELVRGTVFAGRYEIIEELGAGGMGRVYRAFDKQLDEEVALKLIKPEIAADKRIVERFRNEIKIARKITHKNVCRTHDLHEEGKRLYLTMEYIRGEDLKSLIKRTRALTIGTSVALARQVAEGLGEAHKQGIVHRDLKPGNIMIDKDGQAKIMDFGIARSLLGGGITGEGAIIGTPEYMSPEQVEGKPADARSDIYALGVILFEMVVGSPPFEGETAFSIANKHKTEPAPVPKKLVPQLPEGLSKLILRCLEKDKAKRYQTAEELIVDLEAVEHALPSTERVPAPAKTKPRPSQRITVTIPPKKILIPVAVVLAAVAAFIFIRPPTDPSKKISPESPPGPPSVAILYFKNGTGDKNYDCFEFGLSTMLTGKLSRSRFLSVIDPTRIYTVLKKMGLLEGGNYTSDELKKIASDLQATHIIRGSLTKAGEKIGIESSLLDALDLKPVASESVEGSGEGSLSPMVDALSEKLKNGFGLTSDQMASDVSGNLASVLTNSPEALKLYLKGLQYLLGAFVDQSKECLEKAVVIDPTFAMAYLLLALDHWPAERDKFLVNLTKAFELRERVPERERHFIEAEYYHYASERTWDKALESYGKLMSLSTWDLLTPVAHEEMAFLYWKMDEWDEAIHHFEILRQYKWHGITTYQMMAWCYLSKGQPQKAQEVLESYLDNIGENEWIRANLAIVCCIVGDLREAKESLDKCGIESPMSAEARFIYLCNLGDPNAVELLLSEMAMIKTAGWGGNYRRLTLIARGRIQDAVASFVSGAAEPLFGEIGWTELKFAGFLEMNNELSRALAESEKSLGIARKAGEGITECRALYRKGVILARQGSFDQALDVAEELRRIIEDGPAKKRARYYESLLGVISLLRKDAVVACAHFRTALSMTSVEDGYLFNIRPEFLSYLAQGCEISNLWGEAKKAYEEILMLKWIIWEEPSNTLVYIKTHYRLAKVLERMGDNQGAAKYYRKFLDLWRDADPGLPEVEDAKKRLAAIS